MEHKKIILISIGVVAIVVVVAIAITRNPAGLPGSGFNGGNNGANGSTSIPTRGSVPLGVSVPDEGATNVPANVAVPDVQANANPTTNASYRSFNITANANAFSPSNIIVHPGDTLNIEMTAVDKDYDFTQPDYGWNKFVIKKGQTKQIQFSATAAGKFTFYCASCGGPASGPIGYIIVTP